MLKVSYLVAALLETCWKECLAKVLRRLLLLNVGEECCREVLGRLLWGKRWEGYCGESVENRVVLSPT